MRDEPLTGVITLHRRRFLISSGRAAAATLCATPLAQAVTAMACEQLGQNLRLHIRRAPVELAFYAPWQDGSAGLAGSADRLIGRIETASEGAMRVVRVNASEAAARKAMVFAPEDRNIDLHPAFMFFAGLPGAFGLDPQNYLRWLVAGGGQALWDDLARSFRTKALLAGHTGSCPILWSAQPIATLDDFSRMPIAVGRNAIELARGLGADASTFDDSAKARQHSEKSAQAIAWGGSLLSLPPDIPANRPFGLSGVFGRAGRPLSLHVPLAVWERLTPAYRAAISAATALHHREMIAVEQQQRRMVLRELRQQTGVVVNPCPLPIRRAVDRMAAVIIAHNAAYDPSAARINRSFMAWSELTGAGGNLTFA